MNRTSGTNVLRSEALAFFAQDSCRRSSSADATKVSSRAWLRTTLQCGEFIRGDRPIRGIRASPLECHRSLCHPWFPALLGKGARQRIHRVERNLFRFPVFFEKANGINSVLPSCPPAVSATSDWSLATSARLRGFLLILQIENIAHQVRSARKNLFWGHGGWVVVRLRWPLLRVLKPVKKGGI